MNADKTLLTPLCKRLGATLSRRGMLFVGLGIVIIMSAAALLAPWLSPYDPTALHLKSILVPPSAQFPLGTDALGRDVLSRLLYGARVSLWVGFVSVSISIAIGIALGLLAGYFRGIVDEIIMRGVDVMLCFPSFFLILAVIAFLEPSLNTIMVVIGLTSWMGVARLVRAETLSLRERDFVAAARLAGTRPFRIMVMPPDPSWGNMLMEGKDVLEIAPWLSLYPGLAILITVLGYNLLGESLRDTLDPRLKR